MAYLPRQSKQLPWIRKTKKKRSQESQEIYQDVYSTWRWRKLRKIQLSREPLCRECAKQGRTTPATVADHIIPIRQGGEIWDLDNIQSLCHACHQRKTIKEQGENKSV